MLSAEGFLVPRCLCLADDLILLLVALRVNHRRFVPFHVKLNSVAGLHLRLGFLLAGDLIRGGCVGLDGVDDPLPNFIFFLLIGGVLSLHDLGRLVVVAGHSQARQQQRH